MKKTNVVEIKDFPKLKMPDMLSGIRDRQSAEKWGERHGYATVYYWSSRQRVYAEKLLTHVEEKAEAIELASAELVQMAEASLPTGYASL